MQWNPVYSSSLFVYRWNVLQTAKSGTQLFVCQCQQTFIYWKNVTVKETWQHIFKTCIGVECIGKVQVEHFCKTHYVPVGPTYIVIWIRGLMSNRTNSCSRINMECSHRLWSGLLKFHRYIGLINTQAPLTRAINNRPGQELLLECTTHSFSCWLSQLMQACAKRTKPTITLKGCWAVDLGVCRWYSSQLWLKGRKSEENKHVRLSVPRGRLWVAADRSGRDYRRSDHLICSLADWRTCGGKRDPIRTLNNKSYSVLNSISMVIVRNETL